MWVLVPKIALTGCNPFTEFWKKTKNQNEQCPLNFLTYMNENLIQCSQDQLAGIFLIRFLNFDFKGNYSSFSAKKYFTSL